MPPKQLNAQLTFIIKKCATRYSHSGETIGNDGRELQDEGRVKRVWARTSAV